MVGNFQTEAAQKKQESEAAVSKLSSVRKLIAKLLKSINEVMPDLLKTKSGGGGGGCTQKYPEAKKGLECFIIVMLKGFWIKEYS